MSSKIIIYSLVFMAALVGCRKKHEVLPPDPKPIFSVSTEPYWCRYDYIKLVFSVSVWDSNALSYKYLYDDTLHYIKDTLVAPAYNWYFKKYGFLKQSSRFDFILNMTIPQSNIYFSGVTFPIFDLTKMKGGFISGKFISWDGSPFIKNSPYNVGYHSGFKNNYITDIGQFDSIIESSISYKKEYPFSNGYEQISRIMHFAKYNIGLVKYNFVYKCKNVPNAKDTSYMLEYKIKKTLD